MRTIKIYYVLHQVPSGHLRRLSRKKHWTILTQFYVFPFFISSEIVFWLETWVPFRDPFSIFCCLSAPPYFSRARYWMLWSVCPEQKASNTTYYIHIYIYIHIYKYIYRHIYTSYKMRVNKIIYIYNCTNIYIYIYIYITTHRHIEYGIGKLAIFGIPIIELENGYLEYSWCRKADT